MQAIKWPNGLGYDVESSEVWVHKGKFRVFTAERVMLVPFAITTDPVTAVLVCVEQGLLRADLDDMEPWEAQAAFAANLPVQMEMSL